MFWILLSCCNLPPQAPAAGEFDTSGREFEIPSFSNESRLPCCAATRVFYKLYTFPSKENSNGGRG